MSLFVNTNINSLIAQRSLNSANSSLQSAITRLSTGYRVNQAGDDAAGLCVAQGLDTQIRGNKRAMLNVEDGLKMCIRDSPEAVEYGTVKLVGTDKDKIVAEVQNLLDNETEYKKMSEASNPYGDGLASKRITDIIIKELG